ncbi:MAG: glycosyltransferase [Candidatus Alcyoniella australis]|nr:glycosyltransferase [Candidatus Alcyoniella australis]
MRVAIIHDWLTGMRGGEKCLEVFCELWPEADLYTLLHLPGSVSPTIERHRIFTSVVQRLPMARWWYRSYLPLFPTAMERFDLSDYDLVVSSSHCVAKGVRSRPDQLHLCYCYTPMRYVWDMSHIYFGQGRHWLTRPVIPFFLNYLRMWDALSCNRVNRFVSISEHIRRRIYKHYRCGSDVIHPPVSTDLFGEGQRDEGYYLIVSAFAPYKRIDLAIEAFNRLGLPLKLVGVGPDARRLRKMAADNIEFLGWQPDEAVAEIYSRCRAFVFPAEEDFGIAPVEAQASGKPVIAYGRGGVIESVNGVHLTGDPDRAVEQLARGDRTGVFFAEQSVQSLIEAVRFFEGNVERFDPAVIRERAQRFNRERFKREFADYAQGQVERFFGPGGAVG